MAKTSIETAADVKDFGAAIDHSSDLEGYTIGFTTIREDSDLAVPLSTLPDGHCTCPHWGYVFKGRMTVRYGDTEETYEAGDAFYMTPGHVPAAEGGTEFVMFSPADQLAATEAAIMAGMQSLQQS